jgi:hypothetical protein
MRQKILKLLLLFVIASSITINMIAAIKPVVEPSITFVGTEVVTGGIKFTYHVKAGSENLNYWRLYSCAFNTYKIIDASETVHHPDSKEYITFTDPYNKENERYVWFVLEAGYSGIGLGNINYLLKAESNDYTGSIQGPICPTPDFVVPENSYGTIGSVISMVVAALVLTLTKGKFLTFFKQV